MKLTSQVTEKVCEAITEGHAVRFACIKGGISERSYYNWRAKGKELLEQSDESSDSVIKTTEDEAFVNFFQQTEEAHANFTNSLHNIIKDAMPKTWQAACWMLERRYPSEYGRFGQPLGELKDPSKKDEDVPDTPDSNTDEIASRLLKQRGLPRID